MQEAASRSRRYSIRRYGWLQPLLLLVGAARDSNSYAAIEGDALRVRFGWFFNETFPLSGIESVAMGRWPWYYGLGWRSNLFGLVGIVGSYSGVVEIRFKQRQRVSGILPFVKLGCDRLMVSLDEPDDFIEALSRAIN